MKQNILIINARDELLRLDLAKVVFFEADGNYTQVTSANNSALSITVDGQPPILLGGANNVPQSVSRKWKV